jgi:tetratricopeptide (TPR) repeat protein
VQQLVQADEYEKAQPIVDTLLKACRSAEVFQLAALIYARLGRVDEAITLAKEAYSADPARQWIVTEVGSLALHVHRTDIASQCVDLVRKTGHDSPYLATLEGKIALRDGDDAAALPAFRRAVQLAEAEGPWQDAWPHFFLGRTLRELGQWDEAIDVLYRGETLAGRRRRPNRKLLVAIRTQLAIAYTISGDIEGARRIFDLLGTEESGNAEVVWAYALFQVAAGNKTDPAELASETLRRLDPSRARNRYARCQVYLFRALVFIAIGNKNRASEEFSRAHEEDPRNVFVALRWAYTLIELARESRGGGDEQAARLCAEHAKLIADTVLRFHPGNAQALEILELLSDDFNVL